MERRTRPTDDCLEAATTVNAVGRMAVLMDPADSVVEPAGTGEPGSLAGDGRGVERGEGAGRGRSPTG
jgi:hypothetical protein